MLVLFTLVRTNGPHTLQNHLVRAFSPTLVRFRSLVPDSPCCGERNQRWTCSGSRRWVTSVFSKKQEQPTHHNYDPIQLKQLVQQATDLLFQNQQMSYQNSKSNKSNDTPSSTLTPMEIWKLQIADLEQELSNGSDGEGNYQPSTATNPSILSWNDPQRKELHSKLSQIQKQVDRWNQWEQWKGDCFAALEMMADMDESNTGSSLHNNQEGAERRALYDECYSTAMSLLDDMEQYQLESLLRLGPYDSHSARMVLTAGVGGTEATDWVAILKRMYERHANNRNYQVTVEDATPGDQVGYKTVELLIEGPDAYGWLRGEKGAHRLVRLSPFNANNKRQTTFAGVDVAPILPEDETILSDIHIPDSELEITAMRASGAGG